jgi:hypothetical protein
MGIQKRREVMEKAAEKNAENLQVSIVSKWIAIKVGAVDRAVALAAIAALTVLGGCTSTSPSNISATMAGVLASIGHVTAAAPSKPTGATWCGSRARAQLISPWVPGCSGR